MSTVEKPEGIEQLALEEYMRFFDNMRAAGGTNMHDAFRALALFAEELDLTTARKVQQYWMDSYEVTHLDDMRVGY